MSKQKEYEVCQLQVIGYHYNKEEAEEHLQIVQKNTNGKESDYIIRESKR